MGEVILATDTIFGGGTFDFYPGITTFGDDDVAGFPIEGRPKNFRGYYIYEPVGEFGYLSIDISLTKWIDDQNGRLFVGGGSELIPNWIFLDSVYTEFLIPINYNSPIDPDTVMISIGIPSGDVGSKFYVDDLSLSFLEILEPGKDKIIIAGEKDTIKWSASVENITLSYSTDNGTTFTNLLSNYPSDSGKYVWDVPEDLLSAKAKIKIEDSINPSQKFEQSVYIKPWQLTRLNDNGDFELFQPDKDGWQFENDDFYMWPEEWWEQFDYQGEDPITNKPFPETIYFKSTVPSNFPNWELFVDVYGSDQCYHNTEEPSYKATALQWWTSLDTQYKGSCFGFTLSSLLGFYFKNALINRYPFENFNNLYSVPLNTATRIAVNAT